MAYIMFFFEGQPYFPLSGKIVYICTNRFFFTGNYPSADDSAMGTLQEI
jgi:hypothetical protein